MERQRKKPSTYFHVSKESYWLVENIDDIFNMMQLDPNWCIPSKLDDNPMAWIIQYNGFMVDVRSLPRNIQVIAYEKELFLIFQQIK